MKKLMLVCLLVATAGAAEKEEIKPRGDIYVESRQPCYDGVCCVSLLEGTNIYQADAGRQMKRVRTICYPERPREDHGSR